VIPALLGNTGGWKRIRRRFGALLAGIPLAQRQEAEQQLAEFLAFAGGTFPVVPYRNFIGEHPSASAAAAVLAVEFVGSSTLPPHLTGGRTAELNGKGILMLGLGKTVTAMEILPASAAIRQPTS
jgi:3-oxoacyl-[acyl-carrier-protein] synthase-1/3-oxoacyl-[acyl-carrier-protein] synthase II